MALVKIWRVLILLERALAWLPLYKNG